MGHASIAQHPATARQKDRLRRCRRFAGNHHSAEFRGQSDSHRSVHFLFPSAAAMFLSCPCAPWYRCGRCCNSPILFVAQDEGFRKIAAGADYYRAVQGGLTVTESACSWRSPRLVIKVVRATLRAVRLLKSDKKYGAGSFRSRETYVELGKERERFAERAYEAATQGYLASGVVDEKLQREMIIFSPPNGSSRRRRWRRSGSSISASRARRWRGCARLCSLGAQR